MFLTNKRPPKINKYPMTDEVLKTVILGSWLWPGVAAEDVVAGRLSVEGCRLIWLACLDRMKLPVATSAGPCTVSLLISVVIIG